MNKNIASLVLASSIALVGCQDRAPQVIALPPAAAADVVRPGAMTVTGSATLEVSPDCADLTMTLTSDGARPGIAASALAKKQQQVIEAMKQLGLEVSDMKISLIRLNPIYRDWPHIKVATYRAEITLTATTKKFEQIAAMMEAGANAGATAMSSHFRRSDLPELKKKVREMALKAAREKAEMTAKTLGIDLGRVTSVGEAPAGYMWSSQYFPSNVVVNESAIAAQPAAAAVALGGTLQPLTLDITVGFELGKRG